jgi:hypothetical protein
MIPAHIVAKLEEVPERIIKQAADDLEGDNNFKKLLQAADIFRHANATPVFLSNPENTAFCVTSKETMDPKKLH